MKLLAALSFAFLSHAAFAGWSVDESSFIKFSSTKNETVTETHSIGKLNGSLTDAGVLTVNIPVLNVDTGVKIRDERLLDILFNQKQYPLAKLTAKVKMKQITSLKAGDSVEIAEAATLQLLDKKQPIKAKVKVTKLSDGSLVAVSSEPIVLNASSFGLEPAIQSLKEIAKLQSISSTVPVTFEVKLVK